MSGYQRRGIDDVHERARGGRLLGRSPELAARKAEQTEQHQGRAQPTTIDDWSTALTAPPVQLVAFDDALDDLHDGVAVGNHEVWRDPLPAHLPGGAVQLRARMAGRNQATKSAAEVQRAARAGVAGGGGTLPFIERLEASFGPGHDLDTIQFHQGPAARAAGEEIGAAAYATGESIAFAQTPDLHTVAHEVAHVVQQRAGVQLASGVGEVGDRYEQHADAVADAVVRGADTRPLLGLFAGSASHAANGGVQLAPAAASQPANQAASQPVAGGAEPTVTVNNGVVVTASAISTLKVILKKAGRSGRSRSGCC